MRESNDNERWHWVAERELDLNGSDASSTRRTRHPVTGGSFSIVALVWRPAAIA
jgi:hypothetical protein